MRRFLKNPPLGGFFILEFFILVSLILVLNSSLAYPAFRDNALACWDFDQNATDPISNLTLTPNGNAAFTNAQKATGNASITMDGSADYLNLTNHPGQQNVNLNSSNFTICGWFRQTSSGHRALFVHGGNADFKSINVQTVSATSMDYLLAQGGTWAGYTSSTGSISQNNWYEFCMTRNEINYSLYLNGAHSQTRSLSAGPLEMFKTNIQIGIWYDGPSAMDFIGQIDGVKIWNRSLSENEIAGVYNNGLGTNCTNLTALPDRTPPNITYYNMTTDSGCENWNTDKSSACATSSLTPSVQFNTNENAFCSIAGSSSSTSLNINYTDMGSSRNCTGASSGEGGTSHYCTLTGQDELVYDTSYLFISCKDDNNNQNLTSTSGALKLSVSGLETTRRNSIGDGIQNALLSGYINYTDQQIHARNLSNAQVRGTFDRAVKKSNKMWAFNGIGVSDSHVNMFNLTPVLYSLEFANITRGRVTNLTESMINMTK